MLVLPEGEGQITGADGSVWNVTDTVVTCSSNAYAPKCHYRNVSCLHNILYPSVLYLVVPISSVLIWSPLRLSPEWNLLHMVHMSGSHLSGPVSHIKIIKTTEL